jgi:hypothetical protein
MMAAHGVWKDDRRLLKGWGGIGKAMNDPGRGADSPVFMDGEGGSVCPG